MQVTEHLPRPVTALAALTFSDWMLKGIDESILESILAMTLALQDESLPTAGAAVSDEICRFAHSVGLNMMVGYGLTETAGVCVVNTRKKEKEGSVGYPLPGTAVGIYKDGRALPAGEVGEIYLDTEQCMLGYLGGGEPFVQADGRRWIATGDCGYVDEEGFLYFKQRIKNMIKVSGVPVYPSEVEEAALRVPGAAKACAVGIPDAVRGQAVRLYVEAAPKGAPSEEALRAAVLEQCRRLLLPYAVPRQIVVRARLPVNRIGKIDRLALERESEAGAFRNLEKEQAR